MVIVFLFRKNRHPPEQQKEEQSCIIFARFKREKSEFYRKKLFPQTKSTGTVFLFSCRSLLRGVEGKRLWR